MSNKNIEKSKFTRRDFLKTSALSSLILGTGSVISSCESSPRKAKNIIFLVSDGMSTGTLTMADQMMRRQYGRPSTWLSYYEQNRFDYRGLMDMESANSIVTDSAAAACSWGCGQRLINGKVNMTADNEPLKPILSIAKDAGKSTGIVTTTRVTHATPAGFTANVEQRGLEDEIAQQYLEREHNIYLGGGHVHFNPEDRADGRDLYQEFKNKDYAVTRTKSELLVEANNERILGIYSDHHLPYSVDHIHQEELSEIPTLAEMSDVAINNLSRNNAGFILQIEGGRVDHAAHNNDPAGLIYDQIAFDDAIKVAMDFAESRDDTLVIVTTDHGNANPGLNGIGSGYEDSNYKFERIQNFQRSNSWILRELDGSSSINNILERCNYAMNFEMPREDAEILQQSLRGNLRTPYRLRSRTSAVLSALQANYIALNWVGSMHTSDYVELAAYGPGANTLNTFVRNTELFDLMVSISEMQAYT